MPGSRESVYRHISFRMARIRSAGQGKQQQYRVTVAHVVNITLNQAGTDQGPHK